MLVGEVCRFYGWTDEHVLHMPAKRFFAMLEAARKLRNAELRDQCDIASLPAFTYERYLEVRQRFEEPIEIAQQAQGGPGIEEKEPPSHEEVKNALIGAFAR